MDNQDIYISDERRIQEIYHLYEQLFSRLETFVFVPDEFQWLRNELQDDLSEAEVFWYRFQGATLRSRLLSIDSAEAIVETILDQRDELLTKMIDSVDKAVPEVERLLNQIGNHNEDVIISLDVIRDIKLLRQKFADILKVFNFFKLISFSGNNHYQSMENFTTTTNPIILELMQEIFIKLFQNVQWPVITLEDPDVLIKRSDLHLFQLLFGFLIELKTGVYVGRTVKIKNNVVKNLPIFIPNNNEEGCFPMKLMVQPLFKRFENLYSNREELTSDDQKDKEMLFLSQKSELQIWIVKNVAFLEGIVDPIWFKHFDSSESIQYQFIRILMGLFYERFETVLPKLADSEILISVIDELAHFNQSIIKIAPDIYKNNPSQNFMAKIFEDPRTTERFTEIEKNKLTKCIKTIVNSEAYWCLKPPINYKCHNVLVCPVADVFRMRIQDLIYDAEILPDVAKAQLFYLIMDAFNHFQQSLSSQFKNLDQNWPLNQKFFYTLRSFVYLSPFIKSFPIKLLFPSLDRDEEHIKVQIKTTINDLLKTFEDNIAEIFKQLENVIISDFMSDLSDYKNLRFGSLITVIKFDDILSDVHSWESMPCSIDHLQMTTEAEKLFKVMAKIDSVKEHVSCNLFENFSFGMMIKIQDILLEQFILKTNFNQPAINQLKFDLAHGLSLPELEQMPSRNPNHFTRIVESLCVLELPGETRQNLRERFEISSEQEFKDFLETLKIFTLKPETVMEIIDKQI